MKHQEFYDFINDFYQRHGRWHLPWRSDPTPYKVLVSEMMLQQTQVERVLGFFNRWIEHFPHWQALAAAKQSQVLALWKGLGYNSRALRLHRLAKIVVEEYQGDLPRDMKSLMALPGIGHYTAGAIRAFSFNIYTAFIETNIRRVFIYHFFAGMEAVSDQQIFTIINEIGEVENPSTWYAALMDYGATLPKIIKHNPNKQSKHYSKQAQFVGSNRQIRGKILDILLSEPSHELTEAKMLSHFEITDHNRVRLMLDDLANENFLGRKQAFIYLVE